MPKRKKEAPSPPAQGYWPAAVLLTLIAGAVAYLAIFQINDYDIWWHLRTGQWILQNHAVPHSDIYSYTIRGVHWVTFEWLSQVVFYLLYAAAGAAGLTLFKVGVIVATFACIALYADSWKPAPALACALALAVAACGARVSYVERPQIFTYFFTALYLLILKRSERRPRLAWALPPLQVLWCNFHGGASTVGLVLIGGWWAGALGKRLLGKSPAAQPATLFWDDPVKALGAVLAAAAAASLLNPNDWHIYSQMLVTVDAKARRVISEWEPLTFSARLSPIWVPLVLLEAASAWAWFANPSRRWGEGLLWAAFLLLSFRALRFTAQAEFFFAQLACGNLSAVLEDRRLRPRVAAFATAAAAVFIAAGTWAYATYAYPGVYLPGLGASHDAVDAIAFLDKEGLKGNMFNSYELGGQLIWHGNGRPVFVDGRSAEYGDAFVEDAMTWFRPAVWRRLESRWDFQIAVVENGDSYLCGVLDEDPHWSLVYWDDQALVYVRNDGVNAAAARRLGYHFLQPNQTGFSYLDADLHKSLMDFPRILSEVDRSIAAAPRDVNPHLLKAFLLRRAGQPQQALAECETAIAIAPDRPEPYYQAGLLLQTLGRLDEAETRYREAMRRAFRFGATDLEVESLDNLGVIAYRRGDRDQAAALWRKALKKDPQNAAALHNLAAVGEAG